MNCTKRNCKVLFFVLIFLMTILSASIIAIIASADVSSVYSGTFVGIDQIEVPIDKEIQIKEDNFSAVVQKAKDDCKTLYIKKRIKASDDTPYAVNWWETETYTSKNFKDKIFTIYDLVWAEKSMSLSNTRGQQTAEKLILI